MSEQKVKNITRLRDAIKTVIGSERYSELIVYVDRNKTNTRLKIRRHPMTSEECTQVISVLADAGVRAHYDYKDNSATTRYPYIAFYVQLDD